MQNIRSSTPERNDDHLAAGPSLWFWPLLSLALATGLLLLSFHDIVAAIVSTWSTSPSFEYGYLIIPTAGVLVWSRRGQLARGAPRVWLWGLVPAVLAAALATVGQAASTLVVQQIALVMLFQTLVLAVLGPAVSRQLLFPLAYLYFAVPLGDLLTPLLRDITGLLTAKILSGLGFTATLDGYLIRLPTADYRVAEVCAGLRFFLVGVAAGVLAAALLLRSWRRRLLFLAVALIVPIIGNALRATGLIMLAEQDMLGPDSLAAHLTYGFGFIWLLITALLLLAFLMRDRVPEPGGTSGHDGKPKRWQRSAFAPIAAAALILVVAVVPRAQMRAAPEFPRGDGELHAPDVSEPWRPAAASTDGWHPRTAGADRMIFQSYVNGTNRLDLYIAVYNKQREGHEVVNDANRLVTGGGWIDIGHHAMTSTIDGVPVALEVVAVRKGGRRRIVWAWYWIDGTFTANPIVAKLRQAKARLLGGNRAAAVIVASLSDVEKPAMASTLFNDFLGHATSLRTLLAQAHDASPALTGTE
jgi:EpsI family protein